ncbi:PTS galactosamine/N-acetylgalactosamine transporter subunit IIA [Clostridium sardiniense]|uniref:PTS galactosamine/N-acetylgalactosamine transporter subunit IIA n=1 Tax=Clostridium sardiniense TaxID=29369 RepID=UPI003D325BD0
MVGIIVTGHGNFASGILSSLRLIAGEQEKLLGVDFTDDDSTESLEVKLQEAIQGLECDEVLVLSDLAGGSPFKVSVMLSQKLSNKNIRVISGTNLGMILETSLCRDGMGVDDLVDFAMNSGISSIKAFELKSVEEDEDIEELDGI